MGMTREPVAGNQSESGNVGEVLAKSYTVFELQEGERIDDAWVMSTGTTQHMTRNRNWFADFRECHGLVEFHGGSVEVRGIGTVDFDMYVGEEVKAYTLLDVLYVPRLITNFLSPQRIPNMRLHCERDGFKLYQEHRLIAETRVEGSIQKMQCKVTSGQR